MQDGVERTSAELVTVVRQLLDHREPVNRFVHRVVQDMKPDQPGIEEAVVHPAVPMTQTSPNIVPCSKKSSDGDGHIDIRARFTIMKFNIALPAPADNRKKGGTNQTGGAGVIYLLGRLEQLKN